MQEQIAEFFNRFGDEVAGIRQVLEKDSAMREMAETPLFLSIMFMAFRDKQDVEILVSGDEKARHKRLFDTYIEHMFERPERTKKKQFKRQDVLQWLSRLAKIMIEHNQIPYLLENMQSECLSDDNETIYNVLLGLIGGLIGSLTGGLILGSIGGLIFGFLSGLVIGLITGIGKIEMADTLLWDWQQGIISLIGGMSFGLRFGLFLGLIGVGIGGAWGIANGATGVLVGGVIGGVGFGLFFGCWGLVILVPFAFLFGGLRKLLYSYTTYPGKRIFLSIRNSFSVFLVFGLFVGLITGLVSWLSHRVIAEPKIALLFGLLFGLVGSLSFGGADVIRHYSLRLMIATNNILPLRLIPFLDHCVDLIFLRRVGGGYIFVHRLLMEHFAEIYNEE